MFKLDTEHLELQASFKEFAENEVKPLAKEIDETERFPIETVKKMAEMGMMGSAHSRGAGRRRCRSDRLCSGG